VKSRKRPAWVIGILAVDSKALEREDSKKKSESNDSNAENVGLKWVVRSSSNDLG